MAAKPRRSASSPPPRLPGALMTLQASRASNSGTPHQQRQDNSFHDRQQFSQEKLHRSHRTHRQACNLSAILLQGTYDVKKNFIHINKYNSVTDSEGTEAGLFTACATRQYWSTGAGSTPNKARHPPVINKQVDVEASCPSTLESRCQASTNSSIGETREAIGLNDGSLKAPAQWQFDDPKLSKGYVN